MSRGLGDQVAMNINHYRKLMWSILPTTFVLLILAGVCSQKAFGTAINPNANLTYKASTGELVFGSNWGTAPQCFITEIVLGLGNSPLFPFRSSQMRWPTNWVGVVSTNAMEIGIGVPGYNNPIGPNGIWSFGNLLPAGIPEPFFRQDMFFGNGNSGAVCQTNFGLGDDAGIFDLNLI